MNKVFGGILLGCYLFWGSTAHGYFEHTYRCTIENEVIQVSLTTGEQLCLDYMAGLTNLLKKTTNDIQHASENSEHTTGYDHDYRIEILQGLQEKQSSLVTVQQQILLSMSDFEKELFVRVKGIVGYYLFPYTTSLEKKITQGRSLLTRLIIVGNIEQYIFVRKQMEQLEREMMFLDRIKLSHDFVSLIPPLKWWIKFQESPKK